MHAFDLYTLQALNRLVGVSRPLDDWIIYLSNAHLFKMTPMLLVLCGFWFMRPKDNATNRHIILAGLTGCFVAMALARVLSKILPFRVRPLHSPEWGLQLPASMPRYTLDGWSSLPSDHAALSFALVTVLFFLSRRWGLWALFHAFVFICLPRAYLSLHFPSDLLAGALVGTMAVGITMRLAINSRWTHFLLEMETSRPAVFYTGFVFLISQMMHMFDDLRQGLHLLLTLLHA
ncbi:hypothetical protein DIC66_15610 [Rhodoferax lacus]|uniref:Phosphatidic acid phosphatase type 2/haloperoxidase domain-containing protein n=1 Tax=Rhodoferax lacus TaxID=2184758 RepID=A0A3E1RB19_9BURK|nr:phosphatase PAP2 family protein [Rhodoferax lacus]RFO95870.1 hypothetical protein DIC66_15610 [Rhodoferax lacus]